MKHKTYSKHKNSGVDWLSEIPKEWVVLRGKFLLRNKKEINNDMECNNVLSLTMKGVIHRDELGEGGLLPSDYSTFQIFYPNDLVFKLIDLENYKTSRVGFVKEKGIMSSAYIRLFKRSKKIYPKYFYYFYYNLYLQGIYNFIGMGVRSTMNASDLLELQVVLLPIETQKRIASFLDQKTAKIDQLIQKNKKLIQLLEEKRQTTITQAVTRGLDSNAEMRNSGVEWIGKVPESWKVRKLKYNVYYQEGPGILAKDFSEKGVPLIRISGLQGKFASLRGCNYLSEDLVGEKWDHFRLEKGDLLISCSASTDMIAEVDGEVGGAIAYTGIIRLKPKTEKLERDYLKYFIKSKVYQTQIDLQVSGTTISHYGPSHLGKMLHILPPKDKQKKICSYLDQKILTIDAVISLVQKQNKKLAEYRQALISNVVTGKIKV